jgi:hypothetical protein
MKFQKLPWRVRLMISIGLLMTTMPTLINDWVHVPDFLRGAMVGVGLGLEIGGLVAANKFRKTGTLGCGVQDDFINN